MDLGAWGKEDTCCIFFPYCLHPGVIKPRPELFDLTSAVLGCCRWQANISRKLENLELHSPTFTWCPCERVPGTTGVSPIVCTESVGEGFCHPPIQVLALLSLLSMSYQTEHPLDFCFPFFKGKGKIFYFFKGNLYNSLKSGKKLTWQWVCISIMHVVVFSFIFHYYWEQLFFFLFLRVHFIRVKFHHLTSNHKSKWMCPKQV